MWKTARSMFAVLLAAVSTAGLSAYDENYLVTEHVVVQKTTGDSTVDVSRKVVYFPAEIVKVLNRKGSLALVQRVYETVSLESPIPPFGPDYEGWKMAEQGPSWIPVQDIASRSDFKKLDRWEGTSYFVACDAPCDFAISYEVSANGSFKAETAGSATDDVRWSGHMYRLRNVVWACKSAYSQFSDHTVMVLSPRNTPCHARDFNCISGHTYP